MKSVLVDTSIWSRHFRQHNDQLVKLLLDDAVLAHPMVIGELACAAHLKPRAGALAALQNLRQPVQASMREVIDFIERERLYGKGCGLIDICLLASSRLTPGANLWTDDKHLLQLARHFGVAYDGG